jgi:hypothetical protein
MTVGSGSSIKTSACPTAPQLVLRLLSLIGDASASEYYSTNVLLAPPERYWSYENLVNAQAGRLHVLGKQEPARYRRAHNECGALPPVLSDDEFSALVSPRVVGHSPNKGASPSKGRPRRSGTNQSSLTAPRSLTLADPCGSCAGHRR